MTPRDSILIVLGMHRSGTSFLTDCLETLGFALPGDRGDALPDNPRGQFEPRAVVDLNEAMLAHEGAVWARIAPVKARPDPAAMDAALMASFGQAPRIVIKDPRISVLMPAWRPFLESLGPTGAVISLRHPAETAASLARRDGLDTDLSYLSWIAHNLAALETTEGLPRGLVLFPEWIDDIPATLDGIGKRAGIAVPDGAIEAAESRFEIGAVHGGRQLSANDPEIDLLAGDLFEFLARHARDGSVPAPADLAHYRDRFQTVSASARAVEAHVSARLSRYHAALAQARQVRATAEARRDEADAALTQTQAALTEAETRLDAAKAQLNDATTALEAARSPAATPVFRRLKDAGGAFLRKILPQSTDAVPLDAAPDPMQIADDPPPAAAAEAPPSLTDLPAPAPGKPDIFIISALEWDICADRPQHLAAELARSGHRVFYIETAADGGAVRTVAPNLHVLRLPVPALDGAERDLAWVDQFYHLADQAEVTRRAHIILSDPSCWGGVRQLSSQFQITVDCMGDIAAQPGRGQAIRDLEQDMIAHADHMVVSSQALYDAYAPLRPVALIRNGADIGHFIGDDGPAPPPASPVGPPRDGTIRVGYAGAIAEWFDADLVATMARANPDFDIHLAGPVTAEAGRRLADLANLRLHGAIPYADLPGFLNGMDVLIIPFRLVPVATMHDPIAFYDHSAIGKPTVATALPELARAGDLVTIAQTPDAFAAGIRAAAERGHNPVRRSALRAYALENDWSYRAGRLLAGIDHAPLVSVIILAAGAADLTLDCLQSLFGRGEVYPALDVLVVDDGADPPALERLRAAASANPRIRLIENGDNLGAARGSDAGIDAAHGEYLLLLRSGAYVSAGAIAAMTRHLQRHPQIGIVSPLTNDIGTEPGMTPAYATMPEMEILARDLVTGHRGMWSDMPVAADVGAMFRRSDLDRVGGLPSVDSLDRIGDQDHCARFRNAGLIVALAEDAFIHRHDDERSHAAPSRDQQELRARNRRIFEKRRSAAAR